MAGGDKSAVFLALLLVDNSYFAQGMDICARLEQVDLDQISMRGRGEGATYEEKWAWIVMCMGSGTRSINPKYFFFIVLSGSTIH